jgi:hypothetical protein
MDNQFETPRLRALLLASRNQMDWMWQLADKQGGPQRARIEGVLKLIGAIDYALGIEPYTLDMEIGNEDADQAASRPLDLGEGD